MRDTTTPVAAWQDVTVRYPYRPQTSAGPATLAILPGERLLLLGPSGSGKSTLLQTLTGLIPQTVFAEVAGTVPSRLLALTTTPAFSSSGIAQRPLARRI